MARCMGDRITRHFPQEEDLDALDLAEEDGPGGAAPAPHAHAWPQHTHGRAGHLPARLL